jgi:hypothetical protein
MNALRRTFPLACALAALLPPAAARADDWKPVWSDEFDLDGPPDPTRWGYEEGFVRNSEKQYYTRRNARVETGDSSARRDTRAWILSPPAR